MGARARVGDGRTCPPNCPDYVWCNWGLDCYWRCNADPDEGQEEDGMNRFVIGYRTVGRERAGWCWARDKAEALRKARAMSDPSLLDDDLADAIWAQPFDYFTARDHGLYAEDERGHLALTESVT